MHLQTPVFDSKEVPKINLFKPKTRFQCSRGASLRIRSRKQS